MSKPIIVCVVGESGVGKTHLVNYLEDKYGIPMIESKTDRPPRSLGERGHTFVTKEEFDQYRQQDMIAYTRFGEYRYCCLLKDVHPGLNTYVIDEFGMQYLKSHFSDEFVIFAVRIFADESELNNRVNIERRQRDVGKFTLSADHFDYFLHNDYSDTMTDKYDKLYQRIKSL